MWQRFDKIAQQTFFYSQEEAGRCGQRYVCTEHLLLALLRDKTAVSWRLLQRMGASPKALCQDVRKHMAHEKRSKHVEMQLTPRLKRVIDLALKESLRWHCKQVRTEHLLLALVQERDGLAGRMFAKHRVTLEQTRQEVANLAMYATLLRAASEIPVPTDTLLRPVEFSAQTSAEELLRSTSEEENKPSASCSGNKTRYSWRRWWQRS